MEDRGKQSIARYDHTKPRANLLTNKSKHDKNITPQRKQTNKGLCLLDRWKRRTLLMASAALQAGAQVVAAALFAAYVKDGPGAPPAPPHGEARAGHGSYDQQQRQQADTPRTRAQTHAQAHAQTKQHETHAQTTANEHTKTTNNPSSKQPPPPSWRWCCSTSSRSWPARTRRRRRSWVRASHRNFALTGPRTRGGMPSQLSAAWSALLERAPAPGRAGLAICPPPFLSARRHFSPTPLSSAPSPLHPSLPPPPSHPIRSGAGEVPPLEIRPVAWVVITAG